MAQESFAIIPIFIVLVMFVVSISMFIFWIWALVDCVSNEPSEGNDKIIWVLIILFLQAIGALVYYFVRRPQRIARFGK